MKRLTIILFFVTYNMFVAYAQDISTKPDFHRAIKRQRNNIERIDIKGLFMYNFVQNYIKTKSLDNELFKKGYGYVEIRNIIGREVSSAPIEINDKNLSNYLNAETARFTIGLVSHPFIQGFEADCWKCSEYPKYYTIIDGRIVLIYDAIIENIFYPNNSILYTEKSKRKFRKKIELFLAQSLESNFKFHDPLRESNKDFYLNKEERKGMAKKKIYKLAAMTLFTEESYSINKQYDITPINN